MLVLSRKKNESIVINNDITVTVVEIRGDKVRLGIVAPKEVPVHRQEVFDAIHGFDGLDPAAVDHPFAWPPHRELRGMKVGYVERPDQPTEQRMAGKAMSGGVAVTDETWLQIRDRFEGESLGELEVKGNGTIRVVAVQGKTRIA